MISVPAQSDWLGPLIALSFAAASSRVGVATGVLLLPEHNPAVVAKQAASLDRLTDGRLALGVGVGWSSEEFAALGVPFERRAARTAEYVAAMRTLWRDDDRRIPIVVGGNSDPCPRRCATPASATLARWPPTKFRRSPTGGWVRCSTLGRLPV